MDGQVIGNYRITEELARGGMGVVYRAQHLTLPREVVIKSILLSAFPAHVQEHLKARFLREAYIQSQMDHPNIVRVYEFLIAQDNYYMVMEYVRGMSLRDLLAQGKMLTVPQALEIFRQMLEGMSYAHNFSYVDQTGSRHSGIVHRDIKPANILLDGQARVKIADFGIVKVAGERGMTQTGFSPGTVEYMSPEQVKGQEADVRSDIYSLGVTLYEMLAGRLPFEVSETSSDYEVRRGHVEVPPPPLSELRPELPRELTAIVHRALSKNPNDRFQSAAEFLAAINHYEHPVNAAAATASASAAGTRPVRAAATVQDFQRVATEVAPPAHAPAAPARTAVFPIVTGVLALLILGGAGAWYFLGRHSSSQTGTVQVSSSPEATVSASVADPRATATPASESSDLKQAGDYADRESYREAIALYQSWLNRNPNAANAAEISDRITRIKRLAGLLETARLALGQQDYETAARDFQEALQLNPESKIAQAGLTEARAGAAKQRK
ncbi:MAG: serine/threonine-protein kinase [Blastocatellia bacterium]